MDTDGDGVADMEATIDVNGKINYRVDEEKHASRVDVTSKAAEDVSSLLRLADPDAMMEDAKTSSALARDAVAPLNSAWRGGLDNDGDGIKESVRVGLPDGYHLIATDKDRDGHVDDVQYFDVAGNSFKPAVNEKVSFDLDPTALNGNGQLDKFLALANQPAEYGTDGHITHLTSPSGSDVAVKGPKIYSVNGVDTPIEKAISTGNAIRNMHGSSVEVLYNQTQSLPADLLESLRTRSGNYKSPFTYAAAWSIAHDLANGEQVRVFAHSEGAALIEADLGQIRSQLKSRGVPASRMKNLTIITLGGYSNNADKWPLGVNVIAVNNNDIVPWFGGNRQGTDITARLANHDLTNYYPWIQLFADPKKNLSPYYGQSFTSQDLSQVRIWMGQR